MQYSKIAQLFIDKFEFRNYLVIVTEKRIYMTEQELDAMIARINELAHKSKKEGLTEEEAMEQTELRGKYIANFRANFRKQLDKIDVKEADGTIVNLGDKYRKRH